MRSIIPAREALASTDDRPHDPAPAGGAPSAPPRALPPDARRLAERRKNRGASVVTRRASTFSAAGSPPWGRTLLRRRLRREAQAARADLSGAIGLQGAGTAESACFLPTVRSAPSRASGASPLSSRSAPTRSPRGGTRGSGRGRTSERLHCAPASWRTARSTPAAVARRNSGPSGSIGAPRRPCAPPRPCTLRRRARAPGGCCPPAVLRRCRDVAEIGRAHV